MCFVICEGVQLSFTNKKTGWNNWKMMSTDKYKTITLNANSTGSFSTNLASFSFTGEVPQLPSSGMSPQLAPSYTIESIMYKSDDNFPGYRLQRLKIQLLIIFIISPNTDILLPRRLLFIYDSTTNCFIDPFAKAKESTNKIEQAIKKDFMNLF